MWLLVLLKQQTGGGGETPTEPESPVDTTKALRGSKLHAFPVVFQPPPKVKFLTEKEAGAERGKFSDQYKSQRDAETVVTNPADNAPQIDEEVEVKPFRGKLFYGL